MTLNELPYEEYKGWYIGRGITMPSQGIHEINIYGSIAGVAAEEPDHVVSSVEEAKRWIDELEVEIREVVEHGSHIIFTNLDTGETKQYYNVNPPDSSEAVSAALFIKPYLVERWGKNLKFDIMPAEKLPPREA